MLHAYFTPMTRTVTANMGTLDKFIGDAIMAFWNAPLPVAQHPRAACLAALEMRDRLIALNEALAAEEIFATEGTLDKYIGDAIMAFWNAPLPVQDHPRAACLAALDMRTRLAELNAALAEEAKARGEELGAIRIGVGLNTGVCFVGNMGSEQRFNYTVIGDPVNVASRIEGRCKGYGLEIVIGESTALAAPGLAALEIDQVQLVGKTSATRLFTLVGDETVAASERFGELKGEHDAMLATYRSRDWDGAMAKLRRCHHLGHGYGLGPFYELYGQRIDAYRTDPPPSGWDGSVVAEDKH
jgi:adenylate cyclase